MGGRRVASGPVERARRLGRRAVAAAILLVGAWSCFPAPPSICGSGLTLCNSLAGPFPPCFNLENDPWNCGGCGFHCPFGATCSNGGCSCPPGQTVCGYTCVDLGTDDADCGACGVACGAGSCSGGKCVCDTTSSAIQQCGGWPVCVDTSSDPNDCGACSNICPLLNEACENGQCTCPRALPDVCPRIPGPANPNGQDACVSLGGDPANCGTCGTLCARNGVCAGGVCGCPAGATLCEGQHLCADLNSDPSNCGACGVPCYGDCVGGTCQPSPPPSCGGSWQPCCGLSCDAGFTCDGLTCG